MIAESQLRAFLPAAPHLAEWTPALNAACSRFEIAAPVRLAAFLGQIAHESGEFKRLVENLDYRAERIRQVWPTRFPTLASAQPYAHQPQRLANKVYSNRLGNGDEAGGDGWRFRGRGLIQLTGRANYRTAGLALQLPLEAAPEQLTLPDGAALSAAHFWHSRGLNALADENTVAAFDRISRKINGGAIGLEQRRVYWARAKAALAGV